VTIPDIAFDTGADEWPKRGRGGFWRNRIDQAIVSHPDGGKRKLAYPGASGRWSAFDPYDGPDVYARRGQHLHDICDLADRGLPMSDEFIAVGESLVCPYSGPITRRVQEDAYTGWLAFRKAHDIRTVLIEQPWVNDYLKCASNGDRVDLNSEGDIVFGDIKSASDVCKVSYLIQAAASAHIETVPYDVDADKRYGWAQRPRTDIAYIYWYHLNAACKREAIEWQLVILNLERGHAINEQLRTLAETTAPEAFTIVAPSASPDVEHDTEGDSLPAAPSVARSDAEVLAEALVDLIEQGVPPAQAETLLEGATVETLPDGTKRLLVTPGDPCPPPRTTHRAVAADATLTPATDEGDTLDPATIAAVGKRYAALEPTVRSWVTATGAGIRLSGTTGKPTVRRFEALRGLLILADSGFDNDDAVRAIGWHIFGDVAHFANVKPATIIAALDVEQATRFAALCERLGDGHGDMRFTQDARCFIDGLAA
jgi:hypothetical protein